MLVSRTQLRSKFRRTIPTLAAMGIALVATLPVAAQDDAKNIIYFGNSFTTATCCGSSRTVPNIVADIATAAGHPTPFFFNASSNGQSLQYHLGRIHLGAAGIFNFAAPAGETFDFIVLQDLSTQPTHIGDLALHLSTSLAMYQGAAEHSPDVVPVMYETWARGPGHSFYAGSNPSFPGGPTQMQQELRDGYHLSTENINDFVGTDLARYAPAGDAWENADFSLNLYASDIYHAQNRGSLLNALVLYGTMYDDARTSDIDLSSVLSSLNISESDGAWLTGLADATLVPEPTALGMITLGLLSLALRRNRQMASADH